MSTQRAKRVRSIHGTAFRRSAAAFAAQLVLLLAGASRSVAAQSAPISIAAARADRDSDGKPDLLGTVVRIAGRATVPAGVLSTRETYFYLQDGTGGMALMGPPGGAPVRLGDSVVATGRIALIRGSVRLNEATSMVVDAPLRVPSPTIPARSMAGLLAQAGKLVQVRGRIRAAGSNAAGAYLTVRRQGGIVDIHVFVPRRGATGLDLNVYEPGEDIDVTGILDVFASAEPVPPQVEIYPRAPTDIHLVGLSRVGDRRALLLLLLGLGAVAAWGVLLRRQVARNKAEVRSTTGWFRALLENTSEGVVVIGRDGRVQYVSESSSRIHGFLPEERIGHEPFELIHPDDRDAVTRQFADLRATPGKTMQLETRINTKAGGWRLVRAVAKNMLNDPVVGGIVVNYTDITEQTAAETERDRLFTLSDDLLCVVSLNGRFRRVNPAFQTTLGYTESAVVGQSFFSLIHPDDVPAWAEAARRLRAGATARVEGRVRARDGGYRRVSAVAVPDPVTERVYVIARDVTAERERESRIREGQKMEAVGRLAGGIAHDFNNLLTAILSYADFLLTETAATDARRRDIAEIHAAASRAAALTKQLLTFSRGGTLEAHLVDVNVVVAELQNMLDRLLGEDVEVLRKLATSLLPVRADRAQLEQVLLNLVLNARDAMPEGGLVTIETSMRTIGANVLAHTSGGAIPPGRYVMLVVSDTGVGMDDTTERQIFEPFFTTKQPGHGTGLGLTTVYGIVRQSGGFIRVESSPERGTRFEVFLPAADSRAESEEPQRSRPKATKSREDSARILVAEDEESVRSAVRRILSEAGYRVVEATNGADAVRIFDPDPRGVDMLVTDAVMPEMSGSALAAHCVRKRPDLPVIVMSGYTGEPVERATQGLPLSGFLSKPFTRAALLELVADLLAKSRSVTPETVEASQVD